MEFAKPLKQRLADIFALLDKDRDGRVTASGLITFMKSLGCTITRSEAEAITKDGRTGSSLDLDEFIRLMSKHTLVIQENKDEVRSAWEVFDKEGKGYLNEVDLRDVMTCLGKSISHFEALQIMRKTNPSDPYVMDYAAFKKWADYNEADSPKKKQRQL